MSNVFASLRQPLSILLFCGFVGTGPATILARDLTIPLTIQIQETPPSQQQPTQQPTKPRKKVFTNEDFGAPPAEEAREQMYKKASAERTAEEEAWRAEVQAAREALKAAQEEKSAPKEAEQPSSEPKPKSDVHPDILLIEDLSKPKSSTTTTTTPEPATDPVAEAQKRLDRLLAQGQDKGFRETPPPPPQPKVEEVKKEEPKKEEKKKPEPEPEEPVVIDN